MHLADVSVFMSCVMALAVFEIIKAVEDGKVIEPEVKYTSGTIRFARDVIIPIVAS